MSRWYKHILTLVITFFVMGCSYAQFSDLNNKLEGKTNFGEITTTVQDYIKTMPKAC